MRQKKERRKEEAKRNGIECSGKIKRIFRVSSSIPLYHWRESKAICVQFVVYITLFPLVFRQQQPNSTTTDEKGRELFSFYCALFVSYLVLLVYTIFPLFFITSLECVFFSSISSAVGKSYCRLLCAPMLGYDIFYFVCFKSM